MTKYLRKQGNVNNFRDHKEGNNESTSLQYPCMNHHVKDAVEESPFYILRVFFINSSSFLHNIRDSPLTL